MRKIDNFAGTLFCIATALAMPLWSDAQGFVVGPGVQVVSGSESALVLDNMDWVSNGVTDGGGIVFNGSGTNLLSGSATPTFDYLVVNKSTGGIQLNTNVNIRSILGMLSGVIDINGYSIELGDSGMLMNETPTTPIIGTSGSISRTETLNAPVASNPGNIGVEITSAEDLGVTTVTRTYQTVTVSADDLSISRTYTIAPANDNNLDATLRFYYDDGEVPFGTDEADLYAWRYPGTGTAWQYYGRSVNDGTANYVEVEGIDTMGLFTLGTNVDDLVPLPVSLLSFSGNAIAEGVLLHWKTASEENNAYFSVEHSTDGRHFTNIGTVNANAGGANGADYSFLDRKPEQLNFYRLKAFDLQGKYEYSQILRINLGAHAPQLVSVYPNPANGAIAVAFEGFEEGMLHVTAFDISGKAVMTRDIMLAKGSSIIRLDINSLAPGAYTLQFGDNAAGAVKLIKQ